jgi:membrane protease YdiL (CAAX protease family)
MSSDPDLASSSPLPDGPLPEQVAAEQVAGEQSGLIAPPQRIPNFGHMVLFFTITVIVMFLSGVSMLAVAMGLHLVGPEKPEQLLREPRVIIPSMAVAYLITGAILWAIFTWIWRQPFTLGMRWNFDVVRQRWGKLLAGGITLSLVVQLLSNYLPVPKTLPIDDFFRTSSDVWMVAIFGTFLAPLFEELAFRGFLLPSLASTWDWIGGRDRETQADDAAGTVANAPGDPRWSVPALVVSCTLSSTAFALVHADQLAHAWAPLAVLFTVSLVLCGVRLWTQSLAASAFVHAIYNGTIFTILFFGTSGFRHLDKINS